MRQPKRLGRLPVLSICSVLVLLCAPSVLAQGVEPEDGARKFDEFERLSGCSFGARLDNFAIQLQQETDVEGYVIAYGPEGKGSGSGNRTLFVIQDYLVNVRGVERERFKTIYGGRYHKLDEIATELWIVPPGATPPEPQKYENNAKSFTGKFDEHLASDHWGEAEGGTGPYAGDPTLANFAEAVRSQPKTRAYIVAYSAQDAATGAWRRIAKNIADELEKDFDVEASRIKIIFAGYDKQMGEYDEVKVQLWVLPEDAAPPAKAAKAERRPKKLVQLGTFYEYLLRYPDNARRVFEGFADVLREDDDLRACIIVRPSIEPLDAELLSDAPPSVDLVRLAEKWRAELARTYKLNEERLVITVVAATEDYPGGIVETWIVPPGSALPDPYPPQEEETEETEPGAQ